MIEIDNFLDDAAWIAKLRRVPRDNPNCVLRETGRVKLITGERRQATVVTSHFVKSQAEFHFPKCKVGTLMRVYEQTSGQVVPHVDRRPFDTDGDTTHTMIIYLTDDFKGGRLHVCPVHGHDEDDDTVTVEPKVGKAVVFRKDHDLHWSDEMEAGSSPKIFIVVDLKIIRAH